MTTQDSHHLGAPFSGVVRRFLDDRVAVAALAGLVVIVLSCFVAEPILEMTLGHSADTPFSSAVDINQKPVGPFSYVATDSSSPHSSKTLLILGADGPLGRDELLRVLAGGRTSLEIALIATILALAMGGTLGALAGFYGGAIDALISRGSELVMSFPILLLVIALGQTVSTRFSSVTLNGLFAPGLLALAIVIGLFCWFYPARVARTLVIGLREREFVTAAQMVGARDRRVLVRHLLPHLYGPMIVWGTLVAAGVIILEASLSVLGFGLRLGTSSWGSLLSQTWGTLLVFNPGKNDYGVPYPMPALLKLWPSLAVFVTVLCLSLVGDGLRAALDPRSQH
jgi:ABC-type dipeptide/oligopeptide/nickel transport system permease subunit